MLILSQDGQRVVNFKDITDLYVSYIPGDNTIYCNTNNDSELKLGEYKTKNRCKEVLKEILDRYDSLKRCKFELKFYENLNFKSINYVSYVFNMPEE